MLRTYYYDTMPTSMDPNKTFLQYGSGRLTAVQYPAQPGAAQMNDMYSYTQAGLRAAKRLQVNEPVTYLDQNNQRQNTTLTNNLESDYTYNLEGGITSMSYPSTVNLTTTTPGPSYNYSYDSMYRLSGMTQSSTTVVNNVSYNAANQLLTMNYPTGDETRAYNSLNQLTSLTVQLPYYPYSYPSNFTYNYPTGTNNGKISSMYNATTGETVSYTYDSLNRLLTAAGSGWGEGYGFDPFGNLLSKTVTSGSGPSLSQTVSTSTNQIQGVYGLTYDANGNPSATFNGGLTYNLSYDAENRMTMASGNGTYVDYGYDAQNRRLSNWAGAVDGNGNTTNYTVNVYSASGQKLGAYLIAPAFIDNAQTQWKVVPILQVTLSSSDQYFGSRRLAPMDQLGSAVNNSQSYFPWGETKGTSNPQDTWNYATYWQDSFTGLDYANNRYYSNAYGRFMTPDPFTASGGPADPQSWNRYAYTRGDPTNRNDPAGLCDSDDPSCLSTCDPADPICVVANECDPADASCSLESVSYGGSGGYPNFSQWAITVQLDPTQLLAMVEDGFIQANPATIEAIEEGVSEAITLGGAALAAISEAVQSWFASSKTKWKSGSVPNVQEVQLNCTPVGPPVTEKSTNTRNKGGTSVEQEYLCPDGSRWWIHTLFDQNGNVIDIHVRPYGKGPRR